MVWDTDFLFVALYEIAKAIANKTADVIQKEIDKIGSESRKRISDKDYATWDARGNMKKYVIFSLGGLDNVAIIQPYQNVGCIIVFFDFSKVRYNNFKNLGARVWISEERGSIILKPKVTKTYIDDDL